MSYWVEIEESFPNDKERVDLWVKGKKSTLDFYSPCATSKGGRITDAYWDVAKQDWYTFHGLIRRISPEITPTHWMRVPEGPR